MAHCAGQHLLVATAAAEEGLNIPSCQFVVRFNSPQTGALPCAASPSLLHTSIPRHLPHLLLAPGVPLCWLLAGRERLQAKGRTRMPGSVYYELVDEGTLEERLANKSGEQQAVAAAEDVVRPPVLCALKTQPALLTVRLAPFFSAVQNKKSIIWSLPCAALMPFAFTRRTAAVAAAGHTASCGVLW